MYTVKTNTFPSEIVAMVSRLEDALAMCNAIGSEAGNHVGNITSLIGFDQLIDSYKGYVCVNELYEDDEGFNKNSYMYGKVVEAHGTQFIKDVEDLDGLSSNSYASREEASRVFKEKIDIILN